MKKRDLGTAIVLCAIVCGRDGIISDDELEVMYLEFLSIDSSLTRDVFEKVIDRYFMGSLSIISLAPEITERSFQEKIAEIAEKSAAADGLDERENLALQKLKKVWGLDG